MKPAVRTEREEALATLRKWVKPGDTIYTILRHVSRSGTMRHISLVKFINGEPRYLDYSAGIVIGARRVTRGDGLVVYGCGMDMGFDCVYNLGRSLWPNGTKKPHGTRNGEPDSDGGYALKHRWL